MTGAIADVRSCQVITTLGEMANLRRTWSRLAPENLFSDFEYLYSWAGGLPAGQTLRIVVAGDGSLSPAIAPLVEKGGVLSLIAAEMFEMQDLPCESGSGDGAARQLASALIGLRCPLHLHRVNAESQVLSELKSMSRGRGILRIRPVQGPSALRLSPQWLDPEGMLNSGRRSDLRRMRRKASEAGAVVTEEIVVTPANADACLDRFFAVEAAGWKGSGGSALRCDPLRSSFFRRFCQLACGTHRVRFFFLKVGDQDAAAQLTVEHANRLWLLRAGYDERFSRCSPGTLLTVDTIRHAASRALAVYEFCGSSEPWTAVWTQDERPSCSADYFPMQLRGLTASALRFLRKERT